MFIDLDQIVDEAIAAELPWDLGVQIGGRTFSTRPLLMADLARIQASLEDADPRKILDTTASLLGVSLDTDRQLLERARPEKLVAVLATIAAYAKGRAEKNARSTVARVTAAVKAAVTTATDSTSGSFTPR